MVGQLFFFGGVDKGFTNVWDLRCCVGIGDGRGKESSTGVRTGACTWVTRVDMGRVGGVGGVDRVSEFVFMRMAM